MKSNSKIALHYKINIALSIFLLSALFVVIEKNSSTFDKVIIKQDRDYSKINYLYYMDDIEFHNKNVFLYSGKPYVVEGFTQFNQLNERLNLVLKDYTDVNIYPLLKNHDEENIRKILSTLNFEKYFYRISRISFEEKDYYVIDGFSHERMDVIPDARFIDDYKPTTRSDVCILILAN